MKRTYSLLIALVLAFTLISGCFASAEENGLNGFTVLPITEEKVTLTCFTNFDPRVSSLVQSYNEIESFAAMEELTNVHIEFIHSAVGEELNQINLMLASDSLPDIVQFNFNAVPGGPGKLLEDGQLLRLNDLMAKYAPNFTAELAKHPDWEKDAKLDDGSFYAFHWIRPTPELRLSCGFVIREDWLEKLGLEMPDTIDELYDVLVAFRDRDPNGNGEADEIPLVSSNANNSYAGSFSFNNLMMAFGCNPFDDYFSPKSGKVEFTAIDPGYKEFLGMMVKWYEEGLINKDFLTADRNAYNNYIETNVAGVFHGLLSGTIGSSLTNMAQVNPEFSITGVPTLLGSAGKRYTTHYNPAMPGNSAAISAKCQNPEVAVKWLDYQYSEAGIRFNTIGIEGMTYTDEGGEIALTDFVTKNPDGHAPVTVLAAYAPTVFGEQHPAYNLLLTFPQQIATLDTWLGDFDASIEMPRTLSLSAEEGSRYSAIFNDIRTLLEEQSLKIIRGELPLDSYDGTIETIKAMGIDEATAIKQAAYDRFNAR